MKTSFYFYVIFCLCVNVLLLQPLMAQNTGKTFEVAAFDGIKISGATKLTLIQAPNQSVYVETAESLLPNILVEVREGVLSFSSKKGSQLANLTVIITTPKIKSISLSGASSVVSDNLITSNELKLKASGASQIHLEVDTQKLESKLSGASSAKISGRANMHLVNLSGASKLLAKELQTNTARVHGSGASSATMNVSDTLIKELSGAAHITNVHATAKTLTSGQSVIIKKNASGQINDDSVTVKLGKLKIKVIDGDSTIVLIGDNTLSVDEKGNVDLKRNKKKNKFNGHWAGIELGVNGLLTPDFDLNHKFGSQYLDQIMEKSIAVNINFFEQNIPLNKARTFGLVSGLGLTWNNYRFADDVMIRNVGTRIEGYYIEGVSTRKSKLTNTYLTVPIFLELQSKSNKAHIAAGVIAGWRFQSHTKIYFNEANAPYTYTQGSFSSFLGHGVTPSLRNRNIVKDYNSFHQQPFKLDAGIRAGWGIVNLYANYSIFSLFVPNRGPEVYPFAVGVTLSNW